MSDWYNFKLEKIVSEAPTEETVFDYIPQTLECSFLYKCSRDEGLDMWAAMVRCMEAEHLNLLKIVDNK